MGDSGAKGVDPNLALFASWVRDEEKRERDERRSAKAVKDEERKAQELVRAKDDAAADLKRLRNSSRATAEEKAAAEAKYREALAAVVTAETGEAPEWAPPPSGPTADDVAVDESTSEEEPSAEEPAAEDQPAEEPADES